MLQILGFVLRRVIPTVSLNTADFSIFLVVLLVSFSNMKLHHQQIIVNY